MYRWVVVGLKEREGAITQDKVHILFLFDPTENTIRFDGHLKTGLKPYHIFSEP